MSVVEYHPAMWEPWGGRGGPTRTHVQGGHTHQSQTCTSASNVRCPHLLSAKKMPGQCVYIYIYSSGAPMHGRNTETVNTSKKLHYIGSHDQAATATVPSGVGAGRRNNIYTMSCARCVRSRNCSCRRVYTHVHVRTRTYTMSCTCTCTMSCTVHTCVQCHVRIHV